LEFVIKTGYYTILTKVLLQQDGSKEGWAEAVHFELLILAVIWPQLQFCVLLIESKKMKTIIGERKELYTHYEFWYDDPTNGFFPDAIHDLFEKIYKGTELVKNLKDFDYDTVKDVNFILYNDEHYFVAPVEAKIPNLKKCNNF
jgi:hypothetical protein